MPNEQALADRLAIDRTRMALERTFLAYVRTALALAAAGLTAIGLLRSITAMVLGGVVVGLGIVTLAIGLTRYFRVRAALRNMGPGAALDED